MCRITCFNDIEIYIIYTYTLSYFILFVLSFIYSTFYVSMS